MKKLHFLALILIIIGFSCKKDDVTPVNKVVENLDNFAISALAVDGTNTLWVASDSGLYLALTKGYEAIDLGIDLAVTALAYENASNTMWIGTTEGIYYIDLGSIDSLATAIPPDSVSNTSILSAYIDENSVRWFGTKKAVTRSKGETWQKDNFKQNATGAITHLPFYEYGINSIGTWDGDFYFATAGYKLWRTYDWKESVDAFTGATQWDPPYNGTAISDTMFVVFIDSQGVQWFGGTKGVQVHLGHDPKVDNYMFSQELVNPRVHCFAEAPNGDVWCGTEDGISIYNGSAWSASTVALPNNFVTAIAFKDGKVWIGTKKGLAQASL